jgi:hypothetical protein
MEDCTDALEGMIETDAERKRMFKNLDSALDYCKIFQPLAINIQSYKQAEDGELVYELTYVGSDGQK